MKIFFIIIIFAALFTACKNSKEESETDSENLTGDNSEMVSNDNQEDWKYLFDGKNANGWRAYNGEEGEGLPAGWIIEGETLKTLGEGGDIGGDIVYEKEEFGEFELSLEWKISEGGNSGIFYHVVEDEKYDAPYFVAPEYQIIDQKGFPSKLEPWQSIGGDYGMYDPQYTDGDLREVGEWNTSRIVFTEEKVSYWLNGTKTLEFVPWSDDWGKRKAEGKWKDFPEYGTARKGLIGLQDHGSLTWFRNIKIRKL